MIVKRLFKKSFIELLNATAEIISYILFFRSIQSDRIGCFAALAYQFSYDVR